MDEQYIQETFRLAKKGQGLTLPNPMVGAVIVKNNEIIGRGYHRKYGLPHAEVEAINSSKQNINGATLYVNLEPCSHLGKTPPCADLIIKSGISRVVCSSLDPNPTVNGQGITKLKQASIDVSVGVLEKESRSLNEAFFIFHEKKRPFVAIKFAASLDGKIATRTGDSKWISSEKARVFARNLRGQHQSILVGINTVINDDPHLGGVGERKYSPIRIILDSTLKIPLESKVLRDSNVIIVTTNKADHLKKKKLMGKGIPLIISSKVGIEIPELLKEFYERKIISVFVEGGSEVLGSFVDSRLVDKVYIFHEPIIIGGKDAISAVGGAGVKTVKESLTLKNVSYKKLGETMLTAGDI